MQRVNGLSAHLVSFPDVTHRNEHRRVVPVDLSRWLNHGLPGREGESRVAHLAALVSIHVARLALLAFVGHSVLERLHHSTWSPHGPVLAFGRQSARDLATCY